MLIIIGDVGAYLVRTGGGSIYVVGIKIPTQNGQWITADLFHPKIAGEQNPVPMVDHHRNAQVDFALHR